jgi:hypothetical protein
VSLTDSLVRYNDKRLPENFVALAVSVNDGEAKHSGLLIRYKGSDHLCHFPAVSPPEIADVPNNDLYVYRIWDMIAPADSDEVGAFLSHCKYVCENCNITYGYVHDGSGYNERGNYQNSTDLPELGTCVGFCLNILNYQIFLQNQGALYFQIDDWEAGRFGYDWWCEPQIIEKFPDLDLELYTRFKKRITPLQYLCSSAFNDYPIRRETVDEIADEVGGYLSSLE